MRPTPAESLFCGSSASVFDGLRDVSVAEVLDQADADQGHNEQAGEHRDECGVAVGLIRRVGNYEPPSTVNVPGVTACTSESKAV